MPLPGTRSFASCGSQVATKDMQLVTWWPFVAEPPCRTATNTLDAEPGLSLRPSPTDAASHSVRCVVVGLECVRHMDLTVFAQALRLCMGGAPAGPAGTGKTETAKDLGHVLGRPVFVFNCSEQMSNDTVAAILKGLAGTGGWGCFDEFNRISVEVLSVVSTQCRSLFDAIRRCGRPDSPVVSRKVVINGDRVVLHKDGCGVFVTMNPTYAGRTELPQSVKVWLVPATGTGHALTVFGDAQTLFRPVTMVVPDVHLIAENLLLAEGFAHADSLAPKVQGMLGMLQMFALML